MWAVLLTKSAQKQYDKAPLEVQESFLAWKSLVESSGPQALLLINGYWDHSLKGPWAGARSSSLSKKWRVVYSIEAQTIQVSVLKLSAHDYAR